MRVEDIPLGMRLSEQAGWNQSEGDWKRFLALQPDGIWVAEVEGEGVATTAAFIFDNVAWIAMVLVDPLHRGRGIATSLLKHAIAWLDSLGVTTVKLCATPQGRRIYERLGFVAEGEVQRFEGRPLSRAALIPAVRLDDANRLAEIFDLDRKATGINRQKMLQLLFPEAGVIFLGTIPDGRLSGYVMVRPGARATQIGPCVAMDDLSGTSLLHAVALCASGAPVFVDIPCENDAACTWAREAGLTVQRSFTLMRLGAPISENIRQLWALSGPEKG